MKRSTGNVYFKLEAILLHVTSDDAETLNFWLQCPELHTFRLYWLSSENLEIRFRKNNLFSHFKLDADNLIKRDLTKHPYL